MNHRLAAAVVASACSAPLVALAQTLAPGSITNLCTPAVLGDEVVATSAARQHAGSQAKPPGIVGPTGFDWPDTPLGVVRSRDGYLFFGSDGSCHANCGKPTERDGSITRTTGQLHDPLGSDPPLETILPQSPQFKDNAVVYVGGGPAIRVPGGHPGAGNLLMIYSAARWTNLRKQDGNYVYTGLAKSTDEGRSWTDLGFIITAQERFEPGAPSRRNTYSGGEGNLLPDPTGKYFYVYFQDKETHGGFKGSHYTFFSVARVPMDALLAAAFDGSGRTGLPAFRKYYQGRWDQPGLGGYSTSILNPQSDAGEPSVGWSEYLQRYIVIFDDTKNISYAESVDGISWAPTVTLLSTPPSEASALYAVPVGTGPDANVVDKRFFIFYTYYPAATGWQGATVKRLAIDCSEATGGE